MQTMLRLITLFLIILSSWVCERGTEMTPETLKRTPETPKMTLEMIEKQIIGHSVETRFSRWTFLAEEPREIVILRSDYDWNTAKLEIRMKTSGKSWSRGKEAFGRLRLHYKWHDGQGAEREYWDLWSVENLDFKLN